MKAYWILFFVLTLSAISCKKEEREEKQIKSQITGRWELEFYTCGECGIRQPGTYPPGNGNIIEFSKEGGFTKRLKDSMTFNGHYDIVTSKVCNRSGNLALQTSEVANASVIFIQIENDILQLSTPSCYMDGAVSIYRRIM